MMRLGSKRSRRHTVSKSRRSRLVCFETLERREYLAADVVISEFMASNQNTLVDSDGNSSDWIEIHNQGDETAHLSGWSLTDNRADPRKWQFPDVALDAGSYLVVFASAKDRRENVDDLHTNFKLSAGGEYLALAAPSGDIMSQFSPDGSDYPEQFPDISYGLATNAVSLLSDSQSVSYRVPIAADAALGTAWTEVGFDDSAWQQLDQNGFTHGIGFQVPNLVGTDVTDAMLSHNASLWVRQEFQIDDPAAFTSLELRMWFNDGFVAYVNGTRIASANAPDPLSWDAEATRKHEATVESFDRYAVGDPSHLLHAGTNVLAIHGLNRTAFNQSMLVRGNLLGLKATAPASAPVGYLELPTPGAANGRLRSDTVVFSRPSGFFAQPFTLDMSVGMPGATIYYTTDGSLPTESSVMYTGTPIAIATTTYVRAIAVAPGISSSTPNDAWFVTVDTDLKNFSSNLPIVVLENFSDGLTGDNSFQYNAFAIFEPQGATGRSAVTGTPDLATAAGLKRRGSSTGRRQKASFNLEAWDEHRDDTNIAPLGLPANSDWILYAPYNFDRALIRNPFIYELSNQMGRYAVRTRFVELFQNTDGGNLSTADYRGLYVLMEKIKRGPDRVDITPLKPEADSPPEVSGGWMLKIDRLGPRETGFWVDTLNVLYVDPKETDVTAAQATWIQDYLNNMAAALTDTDPQTGYAQYIDVDSWIDYHILNVLPKNPDAFRLSTYFYKDRGGKINMGPIWDYDRSMESADDERDNIPDAWDVRRFFEAPWWKELFADPEFEQRWWDRWFELRRGVLSEANVASVIDGMAAEVAEAQARNFDRWPDVFPRRADDPQVVYHSGKLDGTWRGEIEHMKAWLMERLEWIDTQFAAPPIFVPPEGGLPAGQAITIPDNRGPVYFTTDGSDPRGYGGAIGAAARPYGQLTTYVDGNSNARYVIPSATIDTVGWEGPDFDGSGWHAGAAAVGFDTGVADPRIALPAGFSVRKVQSGEELTSLGAADALLAGSGNVSGQITVQQVPVINYWATGADGRFGDSQGFPNGAAGSFALAATATLTVPRDGVFTFGVSSDGGVRLRIDGNPIIEDPDSHTTGDLLATVPLATGTHALELVMYRSPGPAEIELFYASGTHDVFDDQFVLLGEDEDEPFQSLIVTDLEETMHGVNRSAYVRIPFVVASVDHIERLVLRLRYDDGFVAYLNGVEVARRNAPDELQFDSGATAVHRDKEAIVAESIDLSSRQGLLREGNNVLALRGLNVSAADPDFLLVPELEALVVDAPIVVADSLTLKARAKVGTQWTALATANFWTAGGLHDTRDLAITEVNYDPYPPTVAELAVNADFDNDDFEFIELANHGSHDVDLAGVRLTAGIHFTFPTGVRQLLTPGAYVLVVRNQAAFEARYGPGLPVAGELSGGLGNAGDRVVLTDRFGNVLQDFAYRSTGDWPDRAAGVGSSLERVGPVEDSNHAASWRASSEYGGTPGTAGSAPVVDVLINEVLARSGAASSDTIELVNRTGRSIDVSGWYLSNDRRRLTAHAVPAGTVLDAGQYVALPSSATGLTLNGAQGDEVWLLEAGPGEKPSRFVDHARLPGSEVGVSFGRWPNADPAGVFFPMSETTFGATNSGPASGPLVVSEIHYRPHDPPTMTTDFNDGTAGVVAPILGTWSVADGRYHVMPDMAGDAVALLPASESFGEAFKISATVNIPAESTVKRNALIVFDYKGPTDFKFASIFARSGRRRIGQRTADGWDFLAQTQWPITAETDLAFTVVVDGTVASLGMGGLQTVRYDFGVPLSAGRVGIGTKNGQAVFDDLRVESLRDAADYAFVELYGASDESVDLSGWRVAGDVDYTLPDGTAMDPGETVVVVPFDPADTTVMEDFRTRMGIGPSVRLLGPYTHELGTSAGTVKLLRPLAPGGVETSGHALVDLITYTAGAPWPTVAGNEDRSLQRRAADAFGNFASSWRALAPTPGSVQFVVPGDLNLDGQVDGSDIAGFVLALADPVAYERAYGAPAWLAGDLNGDGAVDFDDIGALVTRITTGATAAQASAPVGHLEWTTLQPLPVPLSGETERYVWDGQTSGYAMGTRVSMIGPPGDGGGRQVTNGEREERERERMGDAISVSGYRRARQTRLLVDRPGRDQRRLLMRANRGRSPNWNQLADVTLTTVNNWRRSCFVKP